MIRNIPKTPAGDHILVTLPYWVATTPRAPARRTTSTIQATRLELAPPSIPRVQPLMKRGYFLRGGAHKANDSLCKDDNSRLQNISLTSTSHNGHPCDLPFRASTAPVRARTHCVLRHSRPHRPKGLPLPRNPPGAVPPQVVTIGDSATRLRSPIGSTMTSHGRSSSINGHCSEKPTQSDSPSPYASNALGRAWLRPLLKQTHVPHTDPHPPQYFTSLSGRV